MNLKEGNIDPDLLNKDSDDYVGLENLTNSIYTYIISLFYEQFLIESIYVSQVQIIYVTIEDLNVIDVISRRKFNDNFIVESINYNLFQLFMLLTYQKQGFCSPYELKRDLREPYSNTNEQQDVGEFAHHFLEDLI